MKYILWFIVSRGIFNQGYLCLKCGLGAHKECLGRLGVCGRTGEIAFLLYFFHFHDVCCVYLCPSENIT